MYMLFNFKQHMHCLNNICDLICCLIFNCGSQPWLHNWNHLGSFKKNPCPGFVPRDAELMGWGGAQALVFFFFFLKSSPGDSNVQPRLRITADLSSPRTCLVAGSPSTRLHPRPPHLAPPWHPAQCLLTEY